MQYTQYLQHNICTRENACIYTCIFMSLYYIREVFLTHIYMHVHITIAEASTHCYSPSSGPERGGCVRAAALAARVARCRAHGGLDAAVSARGCTSGYALPPSVPSAAALCAARGLASARHSASTLTGATAACAGALCTENTDEATGSLPRPHHSAAAAARRPGPGAVFSSSPFPGGISRFSESLRT